MSTGEKTYIAGKLTTDDWRKAKSALVVGGSPDEWASVYESFFRQRLVLRYLNPIELLTKNGSWEGEGFSIVSIQCALIEFLAATRAGAKYRFLKKGETLGAYEYSSSSGLFQQFLSGVTPFSNSFDANSAKEFYQSIRCGLLHEARTQNGWRLWVSGTKPINTASKVVYRDALHSCITTYLEAYGKALLGDQKLQEAFIRKFDDLST